MSNNRIVVVTSLLLAAGGTSVALAAPPAWCQGAPQTSVHLKDLSAKNPREVIPEFVAATCMHDAQSDARRPQIEAARQGWSKRLHMSEADWADAVSFSLLDQGSKVSGRVGMTTDASGRHPKRAWSSFDAIEQWAMIYNDIGGSGDFALDHDYLADALGTRLTEVGRAAYIHRCVHSDSPTRWAMCRGDIARLDRAKLASELTANTTYNGADKMQIRFAVDDLVTKSLPAVDSAIKALVAKDPEWSKVFAAADATWTEWEGRYKTDAELLALVGTLDDARETNSRKAYAGCEDKAWDAWRAAVAKIPAKEFAGMHDDPATNARFMESAMGPILSKPASYLASVALVLCPTEHGDQLLAALGEGLTSWPGFRGPRTATESAILTAGITFDDPSTSLDAPGVHRPFGGREGEFKGSARGVIASLKKGDGTVTITFKSQLVKEEECAAWKDTNRITQIRPDGTLVYHSDCVQYVTVTYDKKSEPQTIRARYMDGVTAGMFISTVGDLVEVARATPAATVPSIVFGIALK